MPDKKSEDHEPKAGHPGPVDHGGNGGMAMRENAPELVEQTDPEDD